MRKNKIEQGTIVKVKNEHREYLKDMNGRENAINMTIIELSERRREVHRELWYYLYTVYPELRNYMCRYDPLKQEIEVLYEKTEEQKDKDKFIYD